MRDATDDPAARAQVLELLAIHAQADARLGGLSLKVQAAGANALQAREQPAPKRAGAYRLSREIGRGGSAKLIDADGSNDNQPDLTALHGRPMSLAWASPEQVAGQTVSTASDVYGLGVLLYKLLTGHAPYQLPDSSDGADALSALSATPASISIFRGGFEPVGGG